MRKLGNFNQPQGQPIEQQVAWCIDRLIEIQRASHIPFRGAGVAPTAARAQIQTVNTSTLPPKNVITPLPMRIVLTNVQITNMELDSDQLFFRGGANTTILFILAFFLNVPDTENYEVGLRKNGDDGTVVKQRFASARREFASAIPVAYPMSPGDYVETVMLAGGTTPGTVITTLTLYAKDELL